MPDSHLRCVGLTKRIPAWLCKDCEKVPSAILNEIRHIPPEQEPTIASFSPVNRQISDPHMSHASFEGINEVSAMGLKVSPKYPYMETPGSDIEEHVTDDTTDDVEDTDFHEEVYDESEEDEDDDDDDDDDMSDPEQEMIMMSD